MRENSLICARLVPVRKFVLFLYPNVLRVDIIISGFPITMKAEKISAFKIRSELISVDSWLPKKTKNRTTKKSLRGFILPFISKANLLEARDIPAISAPISMEKPIKSNADEIASA